MRAWSSPIVPELPGGVVGPPVRVHCSSAGGLVELSPQGTARLYVCGITPYDATHMGHAATYVAFDLLNRAWRSAGHPVRYVQNVTDVDDPLLERARDTGVDWVELAERETQLFRDDMEALAVIAPDEYVGAVESIPLVIEMIQALRERGAAYPVPAPEAGVDDLYFPVSADVSFGSVSNWTREQMLKVFPERGGDPDRPGKKDPLDCLLWLAARPGDPSWDSDLGSGRPGWHIECSAIARRHLGATIDVQGGGSDLVFPHHEMSSAHAQVLDGVPFARAYVHAGMVGYEGEKMWKSRGNLVLVSTLRAEGVDPAAIRLALLAHHYRSDWEWTPEDLTAAEGRLTVLRDAIAIGAGADPATTVRAVLGALATDLDAPAALAVLADWASVTLDGDTSVPDAGAQVRQLLDAALGVRL